ncbi:hypothetical protein F4604DRAFT_1686852 [Suillus subluteus]|nr:hypothetical protein F4604DRAFT_1687373 [Suillus subluteus]KAG1851717.1 hypothetical protein F4604DRAFT_1686852 [Suillus subluteus]
MSSSQNNTNNAALNTSSPQHQLNDSSQPLRSGSRATSDDAYPTRATLGTSSAGQTRMRARARGNTAFTTLGVQPTPEVLQMESQLNIDGQPNPPGGHAGFGDGETQKASRVISEHTKNFEELDDHGELRQGSGCLRERTSSS